MSRVIHAATEQLIIGSPEYAYQQLVKRGQAQAHRHLSERLEYHLVELFLLTAQQGSVSNVDADVFFQPLALIFKQATEAETIARRGKLMYRLGSAGILVLGLAPERLRKRNVTLSYAYQMAQLGYGELASLDISRVQSSERSFFQTMCPLSKEVLQHLTDVVQVLWHVRIGNRLSMENWETFVYAS